MYQHQVLNTEHQAQGKPQRRREGTQVSVASGVLEEWWDSTLEGFFHFLMDQ